MKESIINSIHYSLRKLESIVCDLEVIIDKLNTDDDMQYQLGSTIFKLTCEIYSNRNKIKKILDNKK